jgi:hypothetical protein
MDYHRPVRERKAFVISFNCTGQRYIGAWDHEAFASNQQFLFPVPLPVTDLQVSRQRRLFAGNHSGNRIAQQMLIKLKDVPIDSQAVSFSQINPCLQCRLILNVSRDMKPSFHFKIYAAKINIELIAADNKQ